MLADEQAALRRVAELVARDVEPEAVFAAVAVEASRLAGRTRPRCCGTPRRATPPSSRCTVASPASACCVPADGNGISARVLRTGRPARLDSYSAVSGSAPAIARSIGLGAAAGAPIVVDARTWGYIGAMTRGEPLPAGTEDRLARFAGLVAPAIGNAESRAELTASRVRVIATADAARRRIQRDLHDGAQQRLVHTVITLKLLRAAARRRRRPARRRSSTRRCGNAERATAELRSSSTASCRPRSPRAACGRGSSLSRPHGAARRRRRHPRAPADDGRDDRLLRRRRGAHERRQARRRSTAHVCAVDADGVLLLEVRDDGPAARIPRAGPA